VLTFNYDCIKLDDKMTTKGTMADEKKRIRQTRHQHIENGMQIQY